MSQLEGCKYIQRCNRLRMECRLKVKSWKPTRAEFDGMLDYFETLRASSNPNQISPDLYWAMPKSERPTYMLFGIEVRPPDEVALAA